MRVGIVADTHIPFEHPMYRRFCLDVFSQYKCNKFVHIGDVTDNHAVAPNYQMDANGLSPKSEWVKSRKGLTPWFKAFPNMLVCYGNHDLRPIRTSRKAGLPDLYMKTPAEILGCPRGWRWGFKHVIDGVLYEHGTGSSGKDAAFDRAVSQRTSLVMGHTHFNAGVKWTANPFNRIFGMNVGWGGDERAYAFAYGRDFVKRGVLGCGIVLDGETPHFIPMACGAGERYHRSRA